MEFFFENRLHWQFEEEKISTKDCFRLHIYLYIKKTLIHNSLCVFDSWGRTEAIKSFSTIRVKIVCSKGQADPNNSLSV